MPFFSYLYALTPSILSPPVLAPPCFMKTKLNPPTWQKKKKKKDSKWLVLHLSL